MEFTKMHGLGNDFILVDDREEKICSYGEIARELCDRHFGVGADGLIIILPSNQYDLKMRIFNADGSEPEMCGNGIRCFARFVYDKGILPKEEMKIETLAGLRIPRLKFEQGRLTGIQVDMGEPSLNRSDVPITGDGETAVNELLEVEGQSFYFTAVSMGNPHCVIFVDSLDGFPLEKIGPKIESHSLFPKKTNVEFVEVKSDEELRMQVWERGSGKTLACGTGACATGVAAIANKKTGRRVTVHLDGGDLEIYWNEKDNHVYMTGPALTVFEGRIDIK